MYKKALRQISLILLLGHDMMSHVHRVYVELELVHEYRVLHVRHRSEVKRAIAAPDGTFPLLEKMVSRNPLSPRHEYVF